MQTSNNFISRVVALFLRTRLSIILIIASFALGLMALIAMPKEEDPQIIVPLADVTVSVPGASADEVNRLVAHPLEKLLWQVKDVEDVYATSQNGSALVTVKFHVGTNQTQALVRLRNQLTMHADEIPGVVNNWIVKPISINDVPILNVVLYSKQYSDVALRRIGQEMLAELESLPNISRTHLVGGRALQARVVLSPSKMAAYRVSPQKIQQAVEASDVSSFVGDLVDNNQSFVVSTHSFIHTIPQLQDLVVNSGQQHPVYLKDVATVKLAPAEATSYSRIGFSNYYRAHPHGQLFSAVTLAISKQSGTNAVTVAKSVEQRIAQLKTTLVPAGVHIQVTRNYGETAHDKVNELIKSLSLAILTVIVVLVLSLGWRESMIVAISVPFSFALALFIDYIFGYSINRVTLFALILSLGLVVDDPITNVENIQRHIRMHTGSTFSAILNAVNEVLPPVIMASLTIIVSFLPLFFITGMMGPYMAPMAATVPLTIIFSTVASLTIVPWMAYKLIKHQKTVHQPVKLVESNHDVTPEWVKRGYRKLVEPFLHSRKKRYGLLAGIIILLGLCGVLVLTGGVPLKLLPFDNKNELQLVIKLPEGSSLEQTNRATEAFARYLQNSHYVTSFTTYVGKPSPMDFNGMVRHYYLRDASNLADIRVNLIDKSQRHLQSHEVGLYMRNDLEAIAKRYGAHLSIVELPPGPPVMQTIVAAVTGDSDKSYQQIIDVAKKLQARLAKQSLVVDIDNSSQAVHDKLVFNIDKEKAALNGVTAAEISQTLQLALGKSSPLTVHLGHERQPINIVFDVPRADRTDATDLSELTVLGSHGQTIPLISLGQFKKVPADQPIIEKDLQRVVYVTANTAGKPPADVILAMQHQLKEHPLPAGFHVDWSSEGAWKITVRVFRDMGLGFTGAMLMIYILLFIQTDSFILPLVMMISIPLTIIGIIPGFWLLNLLVNHPVGGYPTPVFFTATSMIGMIALGGIVIRNSLILIDFIEKQVEKGVSLLDAVIASGAVRLRPIVLTALTAALGAWPITLDPIFSGLAWALIFGLLASTTFTLLVIPVTYYALYQNK